MSNSLRVVSNQLSKLGKAMLIPVVAMPVAGLLSRLGQPDLLNLDILKIASDVIFGNLDLLFAVGCILAYTKSKDKSSAVLAGVLSVMVFRQALTYLNESISMGVFGGIVSGVSTAIIYNYSKNWKVPSMFSFFAGEKLAITLGPIFSLILAGVFSFIWPPIEAGLDAFAIGLGSMGIFGVFLFGFLNRALIPTGLHHVFNAYIFYELGSYTTANGTVVTGEMTRFLAGDPSAGSFLVMFYVIMVFGIPGVAAAMYKTARPENKEEVKGLANSGALTSIVAGVTEPIEFSFMFTSPLLYFIHSVFTGLAGAILYLFNSRLGFAFGFNIIDLTLNWNMGNNVIYIIPVGIAFFFLYYFTFKTIILKKDIKTPGRSENITEGIDEKELKLSHSNYSYMAKKLLQNVGGVENIVNAENCVTRMRLEIKDISLINEDNIKKTGAKGVVKVNKNNIQIIVGTEVVHVMKEFNALLSESASEGGK
ncbi:MAG: PTS transporter subunit EIIC [Peptostreptococcaceae bacterium]|nr:PTS transporter subunit EIIC [Peptostreptococcaceae bacterium]